MLRRIRSTAVIALAFLAAGLATAAERVHEDFETTVTLNLDGEFSLENVNGSIQIETWDRPEVRIKARKSASSEEALEQIEIEVRGEGDRVDVETHYPKFGDNKHRSVGYQILVPELAAVHAETVNGNIDAEKIKGALRTKSVNGSVHIRDGGEEVNASTVNGGIEARYSQMPDEGTHRFSTVNGSVDLHLPSSASGEFNAETTNGDIETDFDFRVQGSKYGGTKHMCGRRGSGEAKFGIKTVNGSIQIRAEESTI